MNVVVRRGFLAVFLATAWWASGTDAPAADVESAKPKPVAASRIQELIRQLGADDYFARPARLIQRIAQQIRAES